MDVDDDQGPNRKRDLRTESAKDDISRREQLDQGVKQTPQAESNTDLDGREHNPNAASDQAAPASIPTKLAPLITTLREDENHAVNQE